MKWRNSVGIMSLALLGCGASSTETTVANVPAEAPHSSWVKSVKHSAMDGDVIIVGRDFSFKESTMRVQVFCRLTKKISGITIESFQELADQNGQHHSMPVPFVSNVSMDSQLNARAVLVGRVKVGAHEPMELGKLFHISDTTDTANLIEFGPIVGIVEGTADVAKVEFPMILELNNSNGGGELTIGEDPNVIGVVEACTPTREEVVARKVSIAEQTVSAAKNAAHEADEELSKHVHCDTPPDFYVCDADNLAGARQEDADAHKALDAARAALVEVQGGERHGN